MRKKVWGPLLSINAGSAMEKSKYEIKIDLSRILDVHELLPNESLKEAREEVDKR